MPNAQRHARAPRRPLNPALGLGVAIGAALLAALWRMRVDDDPSARHFALSPQECNTACQTRQTDCIEACDGNVRCERRCVEAGKACVERCAHAPADAGTGAADGRGGVGGGAGAAGRGGSGRGGSTAPGGAGGGG